MRHSLVLLFILLLPHSHSIIEMTGEPAFSDELSSTMQISNKSITSPTEATETTENFVNLTKESTIVTTAVTGPTPQNNSYITTSIAPDTDAPVQPETTEASKTTSIIEIKFPRSVSMNIWFQGNNVLCRVRCQPEVRICPVLNGTTIDLTEFDIYERTSSLLDDNDKVTVSWVCGPSTFWSTSLRLPWKEKIHQLKKQIFANVSESKIANFSEFLAEMASNISKNSNKDFIDDIVNLTEKLITVLEINTALMPRVLKNVTTVLGGLISDSPNLRTDPNFAPKMLSRINSVSQAIPASPNGTVAATDRLVLGAVAVPKAPRPHRFISLEVPPGSSISDTRIRSHSDLGMAHSAIGVRATDIASNRIDFSLLANSSIFSVMQHPSNNDSQVVSMVIAARAQLRPIDSKREFGTFPVHLRFPTPRSQTSSGMTRCAFWNFNTSSWDTTGCRSLPNKTTSHVTSCECSHLTNFALLFTRTNAGPTHWRLKLILTVLSYSLLSLSCIALVITIAVYIIYLHHTRSSFADNRNSIRATVQTGRIHVSLCVALLAGHLIFLAGGHHQQPDAGCKVIGVLLHFFYLSAFSWSVIEGINVFLFFVFLVFSRDRLSVEVSHFFVKASIIAWGVPAIIVIITLATNGTDNYGLVMETADHGSRGLCFLKPMPFYIGFLSPLLLSLLVNGVMLVLMLGALRRHNRSKLRAESSGKNKKQVIGFVGVCVVLNVTWVFGALQAAAPSLTLMLCFVIVNGLQGVFIFVFYCVLHTEVVRFLMKYRSSKARISRHSRTETDSHPSRRDIHRPSTTSLSTGSIHEFYVSTENVTDSAL